MKSWPINNRTTIENAPYETTKLADKNQVSSRNRVILDYLNWDLGTTVSSVQVIAAARKCYPDFVYRVITSYVTSVLRHHGEYLGSGIYRRIK